MAFDAREKVRIAFKKLKQAVYYEKHPLLLRRRLAEFECSADFENRLNSVAEFLQSISLDRSPQFAEWLRGIDCTVFPKGIDADTSPTSEAGRKQPHAGAFVTNVTSSNVNAVSKLNYIFDGPVELHLLSVLWLMCEGHEYDALLSSKHCRGSRLHPSVSEPNDQSQSLFLKYHEQYAAWRDNGIRCATRILVEENESVAILSLDIREYYYQIKLDWDELRDAIDRPQKSSGPPSPDRLEFRDIGGSLFECVRLICQRYHESIIQDLEITHPHLSDGVTCLPIGLYASYTIANWYLQVFDEEVVEKVRPSYYSRFVDDMMLVLEIPPNVSKKLSGLDLDTDPVTTLVNRTLVQSKVLKSRPDQSAFELIVRPGLFLQTSKCIAQFFDKEHSTAGLEKFTAKLNENASDFGVLPTDEDQSPVAQVAYDLLYDGSVNKLRSVKAIAENRFALAIHLAKQTQRHLLTSGALRAKDRVELFRFFKGRNALQYWDMWERVLILFLVSNSRESIAKFCEQIKEEIGKIQFKENNEAHPPQKARITRLLRESLKDHLQISSELVDGLSPFILVELSAFRRANLIRHHLVATPLLNYTSFEGDLTVPFRGQAPVLEKEKVEWSPRYVRLEECMLFAGLKVGSGEAADQFEIGMNTYETFHDRLPEGVDGVVRKGGMP